MRTMHNHKHTPKQLSLCIATALTAMLSTYAYAEESQDDSEVVELTPTVLYGEADRYQEGKDAQYDKNIVNFYQDKDEIERFKGTNAADLLNGVPGVYSADARNNGGLAPNIRGLQGEGRVPVVIDGTQSELTIYRGYNGVSNRSYIDPNLLSEITVYKGATELEYGVPHGTAGAIIANTIDAKDVIPEGKNFGISLRYETSNNSVEPDYSLNNLYGKSALTKDAWWSLTGDYSPYVLTSLENRGRHKFFDNNAYRVAIAGKNDIGDIMMAYSYRTQGNYFSGKNNADPYSIKEGEDMYSTESISAANMFPPGYEVTNTASENRSYLLKGSLNLPNDQKLSLSYRDTELNYGEIMGTSIYMTKTNTQNSGMFNYFDLSDGTMLNAQWPLTKVEQQAGRLDYVWKPENPKWLDLKAGVWYSNTTSHNNSSGASVQSPYYTPIYWLLDVMREGGCSHLGSDGYPKMDRNCQVSQDFIDELNKKYNYDPNDDKFKITNPALIVTKNNRYGVDIANTFHVHPRLNVTVGANLQNESLQGSQPETTYQCFSQDTIVLPRGCREYGFSFAGKQGKRQEINGWLNFDWRPTDKLNVNVGGRYGRYDSFDEKASQKVANKEWSRELPAAFKVFKSYLLYTDYDVELEAFIENENQKNNATDLFDDNYMSSFGAWLSRYATTEDGYIAWGWTKNITPDRSQVVTGENESYKARYIRWYPDANGNYDEYNGGPKDPSLVLREITVPVGDKTLVFKETTTPFGDLPSNHEIETVFMNGQNGSAGTRYKLPKEEREAMEKAWEEYRYQPVEKNRAHSFDPSVSVSYQFNDFGRVYARYLQQTRFPSLYEDTIGFSESKRIPTHRLKPEVAKNFELGFVHDIRKWFPKLQGGDIKLSYYRNKTYGVIDRTDQYFSMPGYGVFYQFDHQTSSGIELQGRMDTGRVFAELGYSYLIDSQMCDSEAAHNANYNKFLRSDFADCATGGFIGGYLRGAIPPKHAVTLGVGTRLLNDRVTLGMRGVYTSVSDYKDQAKDANRGNNVGFDSYVWQSYTTLDAYADWRINPNMKLSVVGTNLTDEYYPDALTKSYMPAPGRTFKLALDYKF